MKRYNHLFEQVIDFHNLCVAVKKAIRCKKENHQVAKFYYRYENEIINLRQELKDNTYHPRPYHLFTIYDPKQRTISAAHIRDRVVHHALMNIVEPVLDNKMIFDNYACRKNKGTHKAVKRSQYFAGKNLWFLKCDVRKYFDSISHDILMRQLQHIFKDNRLMNLIAKIMNSYSAGISENQKYGIPIGNLPSQIFANYYLTGLDRFIKETLKVKHYIRYMDDFILLSNDKEQIKSALIEIRRYLKIRLSLQLKEKVTMINKTLHGIPFLGFRIFPKLIRIKRENLNRFKKKMNNRLYMLNRNQISEPEYEMSVRSMLGYITQADSYFIRKNFMEENNFYKVYDG